MKLLKALLTFGHRAVLAFWFNIDNWSNVRCNSKWEDSWSHWSERRKSFPSSFKFCLGLIWNFNLNNFVTLWFFFPFFFFPLLIQAGNGIFRGVLHHGLACSSILKGFLYFPFPLLFIHLSHLFNLLTTCLISVKNNILPNFLLFDMSPWKPKGALGSSRSNFMKNGLSLNLRKIVF